MRNSRTFLSSSLPILGLAALTSVLASCGDAEPGPGTLEVRYVLGPDRTCDELGVERLVLSVDDGALSSEVACEDAEARVLRLENVPEGTHYVSIEGLDAEGITIMDNGADDRDLTRVWVAGDGVVTETDRVAELTTRPAQIQIAIDFRASSCGAAGMHHLELSAYDQTADILLDAAVYCRDESEGYFIVEDELRALKGSLFSELTIQPVGYDGAPLGPMLNPGQFEPVGAGRTVWVELLDCTSEGCPEVAIDLPVADDN